MEKKERKPEDFRMDESADEDQIRQKSMLLFENYNMWFICNAVIKGGN